MKIKVVGYQSLDYINKQGRHVSGMSVRCLKKSSYSNFTGYDVFEFYVSENLLQACGLFGVDDCLELQYDFDGNNNRLVGYTVLEDIII